MLRVRLVECCGGSLYSKASYVERCLVSTVFCVELRLSRRRPLQDDTGGKDSDGRGRRLHDLCVLGARYGKGGLWREVPGEHSRSMYVQDYEDRRSCNQ